MVTKNDQAAKPLDALEAITNRLALAYRICCGLAPKQAVGELLATTINMPEWEVVRAALASPVAAPEAPTLPETTSERIRIIANSGDKALIDDVAIGRISIKEAAEQILIRPSSTGAAPEAPASEQQAGMVVVQARHKHSDNVWADIDDEKREQLERIGSYVIRTLYATPAATTASASGDTVCHNCGTTHFKHWGDAPENCLRCSKPLRAPAPSRNAAPLEENAAFCRWFDGSGFTKYRDSMWAAWEARAALTQQSAAHDLNRNADWQNGYKTGYETGLGDGRAEFTNPAATSPAERAEPDMLEAFDDWMKRRGALGAGAMPERIFFAGWLAARRAAPVAQLDADLPPLPAPAVYRFPKAGIDNGHYYEQSLDGEEGRFKGMWEGVYTAAQVGQIRAEAVERIRHLERELAERSSIDGQLTGAPSPVKQDSGARSIDTPEFREFMDDYDDKASYGSLKHARAGLVAFIDGRTAGTASDDTKHIESEAVSAMLWLYRRLHHCYGRPPNIEQPITALAKLAGFEMKFIAESFAERAAAPSTQPLTNEVKNG